MGSNQYWAGRVYDLCVYCVTGTPEGSTESGFMEKPGFTVYKGLKCLQKVHLEIYSAYVVCCIYLLIWLTFVSIEATSVHPNQNLRNTNSFQAKNKKTSSVV